MQPHLPTVKLDVKKLRKNLRMLDEANDYSYDYLSKNFGPDCMKKIASDMKARNITIMTELTKT